MTQKKFNERFDEATASLNEIERSELLEWFLSIGKTEESAHDSIHEIVVLLTWLTDTGRINDSEGTALCSLIMERLKGFDKDEEKE